MSEIKKSPPMLMALLHANQNGDLLTFLYQTMFSSLFRKVTQPVIALRHSGGEKMRILL